MQENEDENTKNKIQTKALDWSIEIIFKISILSFEHFLSSIVSVMPVKT